MVVVEYNRIVAEVGEVVVVDIARQAPILSQTCLNSLHTSQNFLSVDKKSASVPSL